MMKRFGRRDAIRSFFIPAILFLSIAFSIGFVFWPHFYYVKNEVLITVAIVGTWRYGLLFTNYLRAMIYSLIVYPRLKKRIEGLDESARYPDHIYFVIPSYKEEPWVSVEVFQSLFEELESIPCSATLIVSTGSDHEDSVINSIVQGYNPTGKIKVVLQRQSQGKRIAMGHALRAVAREFNDKLEHDENSITIFMDGDSYLGRGTLKKCIPIFSVMPKMGAVTTNEVAYIDTQSKWYMDWFNLKFGQRHVLFQSQSLSKRVMTLTGRFSVFRTKAVVSEAFISMIENDIILHPYHGKFRFLMGDDKSSWFNLMKNGWQMLYVPDALVYSLESRDGNFLELSRSLPYRWYGNTLRNNERAKKLKTTPPFIKYLLWDQLFLMWTSLVGIVGSIYLAIFVDFVYLPIYIAWVFLVRVVQMLIITLTGHPVSIRTIPLMLYGQWVGAFIKIKAYFNLADQKWSKGGTEVQKADDDVAHLRYAIAPYFSKFRLVAASTLFLFAMLLSNERFVLTPNAHFFSGSLQASEVKKLPIKALIADDGKDDAQAINLMIAEAKSGSVIHLPSGVLDIEEPILIERGDISLVGNNTTLLSHLHHSEEAVIIIKGRSLQKVGVLQGNLYGQSSVKAESRVAFKEGDLLLIEKANDRGFIKRLGATKWYKKYPIIRSEIVEVKSYKDEVLEITTTSFSELDHNATITLLNPVSGVSLKHLTIRSDYHTKHQVYEYENVDKSRQVDGIKLLYTKDCHLEDIAIYDSGSNPLVFERSYRDSGKYLKLSGALNKGKKGNGYLRINKSFYIDLEDIEVKNLRHIVFQWAAAYNQIKHLYALETDINFHGGGSHDNRVEDVTFNVNDRLHKWGEVYYTPKDASWAPPDYDTNRVINRKSIKF